MSVYLLENGGFVKTFGKRFALIVSEWPSRVHLGISFSTGEAYGHRLFFVAALFLAWEISLRFGYVDNEQIKKDRDQKIKGLLK